MLLDFDVECEFVVIDVGLFGFEVVFDFDDFVEFVCDVCVEGLVFELDFVVKFDEWVAVGFLWDVYLMMFGNLLGGFC